MEFGFNRIVVLPRTTNRFLFPSLIWLLTVIIYVSVLDKSVLFLWAKTWTYSRCVHQSQSAVDSCVRINV